MQILHLAWVTLVNATDIAGRRRLIFKFRALELTPQEMQVLISEHYSVSIDTVRRDLRLMADWLPGMLSLQEDETDESLYRLVGLVQMAQRQLAKLSFSADNDNARVGAAKALAAIACKEIELRQDLGRICRAPIQIQHIDPVDLEGLDERAAGAILANFEAEEADRHRRMELENSHLGEFGGQESVKSWVGPQGSPTANEGRTEAPNFGSPVKDTSLGGSRIGGYIVERK